MTHDGIYHTFTAKKFFTYANPAIDYRPQKDNPHQIWLMVGGNLINYDGKASVQTADLDRLDWAKKVSLAAICLVAGSASFGLREN